MAILDPADDLSLKTDSAARTTSFLADAKSIRFLDSTLGLILFAWFGFTGFQIAFSKLAWQDWIAYALPSANLVARGALTTPQLGSFAHFDRIWLFHGPLMGLGPAPFYYAFHIGRVPYLSGIVVGYLVNLLLITWFLRRTISGHSWAASVLGSQAFLGHRHLMSAVYIQRYDILGLFAISLAFAPVFTASGRIPAWRWLFAALLPSIHPALGPASLIWLVAASIDLRRRRTGPSEPGRPAWAGPALYLLAGLACLAWYIRPEGLKEQFFPYLRCMAHRNLVAVGPLTMFRVQAGFPYNLVSMSVSLTIALTAVYLCVRPSRNAESRPVGVQMLKRLPAAVIVLFVLFDMVRRFQYLDYYVLGLAPALLFLADTPVRRRVALAMVLVLAAANVVVSLRIDRQTLFHAQSLADQDQEIALIVELTRPGDRIVLGPPFVLSAAPPVLPGDRRVVAVSPQVWCLEDFDVPSYREELRRSGDVYLGERTWYDYADSFDATDEVMGRTPKNPRMPLFEGATTREVSFEGRPIVVARNPVRGRPTTTTPPLLPRSHAAGHRTGQ
ncbi:MAG: hypothetical protein JWN86_2664 [Planctomycetota bacterium]|nr:hypothetical protein [Planctomycetota bacterium]